MSFLCVKKTKQNDTTDKSKQPRNCSTDGRFSYSKLSVNCICHSVFWSPKNLNLGNTFQNLNKPTKIRAGCRFFCLFDELINLNKTALRSAGLIRPAEMAEIFALCGHSMFFQKRRFRKFCLELLI